MRPAEPPPARQAPRHPPLGLVRAALLGAVLTFGAAVWWLQRERQPPENMDAARALGVLVLALALGAVAAALGLRGIVARTADPRRQVSLRIAAWAVGEAAALAGGVHWLMSGDPSRYLAGLVAMLAVFILVPARAR